MSKSQERQSEEKNSEGQAPQENARKNQKEQNMADSYAMLSRIMWDTFKKSPSLLILPLLATALFAVSGIVKPYFYSMIKSASSVDLYVLSGCLVIIVFLLMIFYLESGSRRNTKTVFIDSNIGKLSLKDYKEDINNLKSLVTNFVNSRESNIIFTDEQKQEIYQVITSSISNNLTEVFFDSLKESVKNQIIEDKTSQFQLLNKRSEASVDRLLSEINQLSKRANLNLAIGSTVTITALITLSYFVIHENFNSDNTQKILLHFIPRLSLVVFIEFFSFFFLKLYRNSLHEIKYYQNELTNLELKATAIAFAVNYGKEDDVSLVIKEISSTERNFKLQKDESTVELERNKAETHDLKEILKAALGTVPKKDK